MCRRELLCEVIRQVLETWRPHYLVDAKVDLFYEPEILAVHRARALSFYCAVAYSVHRVVVDKDGGGALPPANFLQGEL